MFETRTSSSAVRARAWRAPRNRCAARPRAVALLLMRGRDADIEEMALAGADRDDAVADDALARLVHLADVTEPETVAQDAFGPRELVGGTLDRQHRGHVRLLHVAQVRGGG